MPYSIFADLGDGSLFPGFLYLPGEPVPGLQDHPAHDVHCDYCGEPMDETPYGNPVDGGSLPAHPGTGDHRGIVSAVYAPVPGARPMEGGYGHLRCACDYVDGGAAAGAFLAIGEGDPLSPAHYDARHAA